MAEIENISLDGVVYNIKDAGAVQNIVMNGGTVTKTDGVADLGTVITDVSGKQDTLESGVNIKTINNESLLGSGNLTVVTDISGKEDKSNKVTSISAQSTDVEYPSAKCMYDIVGDVESLLAAL